MGNTLNKKEAKKKWLPDGKVWSGQERLNLEDRGITSMGDDITLLTALKWLNLSRNELREVPGAICQLTSLEVLKLMGNQFVELPISLSRLTNLTVIDLSKNNLVSFPEVLCTLTKLQDLSIQYNKLRDAPESLENLKELKNLNFYVNRIQKANIDWSKLSELVSLDLSHNSFCNVTDQPLPRCVELNALGSNISSLTLLSTLGLCGNNLTRFPIQISLLHNLRYLDLRFNRISALPATMYLMKNLRSLKLHQNRIERIESICELVNLEELGLVQNQICVIPEQISKLVSIKTLLLSQNLVRHIPDTFGSLKTLRELDLACNKLEKLPRSFSSLSQLALLSLEYNRLSQLDHDLKLNFLIYLHLSYNRLIFFPSIGHLTSVARLELSNNDLSVQMSQFCNFVSLYWLDLGSNRITKDQLAMDSPHTSLLFLNLFANDITELPPDFSENLSHLEVLDLSYQRYADKIGSGSSSSVAEAQVTSTGAQGGQERVGKEGQRTRPAPKLQEQIAQLCSFSRLTELRLDGLGVTKLPELNIPSLRLLSISDNYLTVLDGQALSKVSSLELLWASCNKIRRVLRIGCLSKLRELDLSHNDISSVGDDFSQLTELQDLDLSGNRLKRFSCLTFRKLVQLKISFNDLKVANFRELASGSLWVSPNRAISVEKKVDLSFLKLPFAWFQEEFSELKRTNASSPVNGEGGSALELQELDSSEREDAVSQMVQDSGRLPYWKLIGWSQTRGRRPEMQDTISILPYMWKEEGKRMFVMGMFDGHGGCQSSQMAAEQLEGLINMTFHRKKIKSDADFFRIVKSYSDAELSIIFQNIYWKLQTRMDKMHAQQPAPKLDMGAAASIVLVCEDVSDDVLVSSSSDQMPHDPSDGALDRAEVRTVDVEQQKTSSCRNAVAHVHRSVCDMRVCLVCDQGRLHDRRASSSEQPQRRRSRSLDWRQGEANSQLKCRIWDDQDSIDSVFNDNFANSGHRFSDNLNHIDKKQGPISKEKPKMAGVETTCPQVSSERRVASGSMLLVITNCGDQRVVFYNGDESAYLQTSDHKPGCEQEKERIYREGGFVAENRRSCGILALSRSLGDSSLQPYVTYQPDIHVYELTPHKDAFIIIACDGIWDVMSSRRAIQIAKIDLSLPDFPCRAATRIRNYAYSLNSSDNLSVIVYKFNSSTDKKSHRSL